MEEQEKSWVEGKEAEEEEEERETTLVKTRRSRIEKDDEKGTQNEVKNGMSERNWHANQSILTANGARNGGIISGIEQKIEELEGVLEDEAEYAEMQQKPENLVFLDKVEGIWKCRICSWTHQNGIIFLDHIQNQSGERPKQMNHKNSSFETEDEEVIKLLPTPVRKCKASDFNGKLNISVAIPLARRHEEAKVTTELVVGNGKANSKCIYNSKGTVITIGTPSASEIEQGVPVPEKTAGEQLTPTKIDVAVSERTEVNKDSTIEVIKSIVYGGLAESITSLSVVSSAAGGDVTTLNILALGLATLIGGFSVICHNLWELRSDRIDQLEVSHQAIDQQDLYEELLGRRENFLLHAIVAVLSYLIFGSLPAVVYGFSFRVSDDKELKLVVMGATSFLCITALAIGKTYVSRPPKTYVKFIMTFFVLGFMASGISYVAGVLIKRILEKLGLFQSSSVANLILSEMAPKDSAWASY